MILTQTFFAADQGPSSSPDVVSATMDSGIRAPPAHSGTPALSHIPTSHAAHHLFGNGGHVPPHSPVGSPGGPRSSGMHPHDGPVHLGHHNTHPSLLGGGGGGGGAGGGHMSAHSGLGLNSNHLGAPGLIVPTPQRTRTIKSYHCRMCDQIFDNKSDLLVHSQTVHKADPKPYRCPTCQKCFANSSYLSQHARIHAGIKPYKCQICERRFTQLCHLQQHIRTHTGEKPYKCQHPGCGKAFSQLSNLQSHSRSHMTDKPYRCNSCYKCFADEQGLRDHIPKHSETKHLKTFICRICGKSYTQETYLARHMTKHQGVDPVANMLNLTSLRHQQQRYSMQAAVAAAHHGQHNQGGQHPGGEVGVSVHSGGGGGGVGQMSPTQASAVMSQHGGFGHHMVPQSQLPGGALHHRQGQPDLPDIKPLLEGNGFDAVPPGSADINKAGSAFLPLGHAYASANMMNTSVPSNFPFGAAPRLPHTSTTALNSSLARLSPSGNSTAPHYFPFEALSNFPKPPRDSMVDGRMAGMAEGMLASSLLRLQQIREFSHSVFPKNEQPNTPAAHAAAAAAAAAAHKEYAHKDYQ